MKCARYHAGTCVTENTLRDNIVELALKNAGDERIGVRELRTLDPKYIATDLVLYRVFHQPGVWFDSEVFFSLQVRYQQPSGSQASTSEIKNPVMFAKPQGTQQSKLGCPHEIVLLSRPDITPVPIWICLSPTLLNLSQLDHLPVPPCS